MHIGPATDGLTPREGEAVLSRTHPLTRAQVEALGFDPKYLDPGIRDLVLALRAEGFRTTDSGDGVSKCEAGIVIPFPHVFMTVSPYLMVTEADRLHALLTTGRLPASGDTFVVEATYNPRDGIGVLALLEPPE